MSGVGAAGVLTYSAVVAAAIVVGPVAFVLALVAGFADLDVVPFAL